MSAARARSTQSQLSTRLLRLGDLGRVRIAGGVARDEHAIVAIVL